MKKYIEILKQTQLFAGIKDNELSAMLDCLQATIKTYKKGEYIFREGDYIDKITILVQGKLIILGKPKHCQCNPDWRNVWGSLCHTRQRSHIE